MAIDLYLPEKCNGSTEAASAHDLAGLNVGLQKQVCLLTEQIREIRLLNKRLTSEALASSLRANSLQKDWKAREKVVQHLQTRVEELQRLHGELQGKVAQVEATNARLDHLRHRFADAMNTRLKKYQQLHRLMRAVISWLV